ncbi:hypothetical protein ACKF11_13745 [Methylobacillus sp. Pita2]|uniref:hypothetical protein n=1 Tax=Methylobacillus sp. Pita2 TaxID=3383245 RepID=UPI0038B6190B
MASTVGESLVYQKMADKLGLNFRFGNQDMTSEEVFSPDGALPLFFLFATRSVNDFMPETDVGILVEKDPNSLLGVRASLASGISSASSRFLFVLDAITEAMKRHLITGNVMVLDGLYHEVANDIASIIQNKPEPV